MEPAVVVTLKPVIEFSINKKSVPFFEYEFI